MAEKCVSNSFWVRAVPKSWSKYTTYSFVTCTYYFTCVSCHPNPERDAGPKVLVLENIDE